MAMPSQRTQDRVLVYYAADAPGPGILAGRVVYPGERHTITDAAYRRAARRNGHFTLAEADGAPAAETATAPPESAAPADLKAPASMTVEEALAYAATLDTDARVAFRALEAARTKPRATLLGALDASIQEAQHG